MAALDHAPIPARWKRTLPRTGDAAQSSRRLLGLALNRWDLAQVFDPAALVLSELVTNAVRHGHGDTLDLTISWPFQGLLHLAVVDRAPCDLPRIRDTHILDTFGRGLRLVEACTQSWGYDVLGGFRPWGKRVWAELEVLSHPSGSDGGRAVLAPLGMRQGHNLLPPVTPP